MTKTKRANTAKKKNTTALAKAAKGVSLPAVAKAAKAVPVPVILLAIGACAVGALALFFFDTTEGQRRRELVRTKALQASRSMSEIATKGGREVKQRLESVATGATQRLRGERADNMNGRSEQRTGEQPMHV